MDWNDIMRDATAEDEQNDRLQFHVQQYQRFVMGLGFKGITGTNELLMIYRHRLDKLRNACIAFFTPSGDLEIDDMFAQLTERLNEYQAMLQGSVMASGEADVTDPKDVLADRQTREQERRRWRADRD